MRVFFFCRFSGVFEILPIPSILHPTDTWSGLNSMPSSLFITVHWSTCSVN